MRRKQTWSNWICWNHLFRRIIELMPNIHANHLPPYSIYNLFAGPYLPQNCVESLLNCRFVSVAQSLHNFWERSRSHTHFIKKLGGLFCLTRVANRRHTRSTRDSLLWGRTVTLGHNQLIGELWNFGFSVKLLPLFKIKIKSCGGTKFKWKVQSQAAVTMVLQSAIRFMSKRVPMIKFRAGVSSGGFHLLFGFIFILGFPLPLLAINFKRLHWADAWNVVKKTKKRKSS